MSYVIIGNYSVHHRGLPPSKTGNNDKCYIEVHHRGLPPSKTGNNDKCYIEAVIKGRLRAKYRWEISLEGCTLSNRGRSLRIVGTFLLAA